MMATVQEVSDLRIVYVTPDEIDYFDKMSKSFGIKWKSEDRNNGVFPISKSYVGYLVTPFRRIDLQPKYIEITMEHVFRIYLYVYGYKPNDSGKVLDVAAYSGNVDVADLFLRNLEQNIKMGILRSYKKERIYSRRVAGKIYPSSSYARYLQNKKKYVVASKSVLTLENSINNLIVSALDKLMHLKRYASSANSYRSYFNIPGTVTNGAETFKKINFNNLNERYRTTVLFASMIIDQLDYDDVGDEMGTESFVMNFDRLFEEFVAKVLLEVPEKKKFLTWDSAAKFADVIRNGEAMEAREYLPDIVYDYKDEDENHNFLPSAKGVLDVKNKAYTQFKNSDVYQLLTYREILNCKKMILIYPSFGYKNYEMLQLPQDVFTVSEIYACFVNIVQDKGEDFLESIKSFVLQVEKVLNL